jgi:hypothetical protein
MAKDALTRAAADSISQTVMAGSGHGDKIGIPIPASFNIVSTNGRFGWSLQAVEQHRSEIVLPATDSRGSCEGAR